MAEKSVIIGGRYELSKKLGQGAHGIVYLGTDQQTGQACALKLLGKQWQDADLRHRFENEARQSVKMHHPHIVRVDAFGEHQGRPYIVMEYLEGESLSLALKRQPRLGEDKVWRLLRGVASGLAYAHEMGVIHRDIKPENLFLCRGSVDEMKIVDFGIAKANDEVTSVTQTGAIVGTPGYIAPERLRGATFDGRADVYALGAVAYLALTGAHPYSEGKGGPIEIVLAVLNDPLIPVRDLAPDVSPRLAELVQSLLVKHDEKRPTADWVAREEF